MSDSEDKTRYKPAKALPADDKTRIAPTRQTVNESQADATRMAKPRQRQPAPSEDSNDVTRFKKPSALQGQAPDDATRIAPSSARVQVAVPPQPPANDRRPLEEGSAASAAATLKKRFILEKVLGAGGMGVVYKAKDLVKVEAHDKHPYLAVKVLSEEFKTHPEAFISLQRESRKTQHIAHPNIVNVHDFDRDGDTVFMTMEYMEGNSLDKLIQQYKATGLPTDDAWSIIKEMCSALVHAHEEKIIHSDFKPGNVFVTNSGKAKVFDFGIARAVAQAQNIGDTQDDHTVFDAGNLGALTPAYASLEMLQGQVPDVRDDVYALGCVVYEIFTGAHPFNKVPADEAERLKLKPKRITSISKRRWRVLEKALAFHREDRVESVKLLLEGLTQVYIPAYKVMIISLVLVIIAISTYFLTRPPPEGVLADDIRNEVELQLRLDFAKELLSQLLESPDFSAAWQTQLLDTITALRKQLSEADPWLQQQLASVYELYLKQIAATRTDKQFTRCAELIKAAQVYAGDDSRLNQETALLAKAIEDDKIQQERLAAQRRNNAAQKAERVVVSKKQKKAFDIALDNVTEQLKCSGKLNMRNIATAVKKLKVIDAKGYARLKNRLAQTLAACLADVGKSFPEWAKEAKKYALHIFPGNKVIAATNITPRDPCDKSLAGLGARGNRGLCRDKLAGIGSGPELVVVPPASGIKSFALGKYEVSVKEMNQFCRESKQCKEVNNLRLELPATKVSIKMVDAYLRWLTKKADRKYRLPTVKDWQYAAKARSGKIDANRNCKLNSRGISKGGQLLNSNAGGQNEWGLVNLVGNAQEFAYDKGRQVVVLGGSYERAMDACTTATKLTHTGTADAVTGFRVLRELKK